MWLRCSTLLGISLFCSTASAVPFGGVEFPSGAASFADSVVSYDPLFGGGPAPAASNQHADNAIGTPDINGYVSLGAGGRIVLRFTNNLLTGSNNSNFDLWVFEVGADVEDTFVDISKDGLNWISVGKVFGATSGIDIDAFGFGTGDEFAYIRLTDDPNEGERVGSTVGADIDAVGAISTTVVPEPGSLALAGLAIAGVMVRTARRRT